MLARHLRCHGPVAGRPPSRTALPAGAGLAVVVGTDVDIDTQAVLDLGDATSSLSDDRRYILLLDPDDGGVWPLELYLDVTPRDGANLALDLLFGNLFDTRVTPLVDRDRHDLPVERVYLVLRLAGVEVPHHDNRSGEIRLLEPLRQFDLGTHVVHLRHLTGLDKHHGVDDLRDEPQFDPADESLE